MCLEIVCMFNMNLNIQARLQSYGKLKICTISYERYGTWKGTKHEIV
jgi:hypothetical protein